MGLLLSEDAWKVLQAFELAGCYMRLPGFETGIRPRSGDPYATYLPGRSPRLNAESGPPLIEARDATSLLEAVIRPVTGFVREATTRRRRLSPR
ncbi:MAG: hypothetical protein WDM81_17830 [Rhizomicrobium sp.]